jgi:cysteine desulfurase
MSTVAYLDYNASTPCDPRVVAAMTPYFGVVFANPTSRNHQPGREAFTALEEARRQAASVIGAQSTTEITFTSGATEANNLAIRCSFTDLSGYHVITQRTEHLSVLEPMRWLARTGAEVTVLGVGRDGLVDLEELAAALRPTTRLVSIMLANNETGVIQPIPEIAELVHHQGALLHCDAAQAVGKIPVRVLELGADMLSMSAHKFYGPKGIGCLYRGRDVKLEALIIGGGQERGLRSGTPNLPAIVGMAEAMSIAAAELDDESGRIARQRDRFEAMVLDGLDGVTINGCLDRRLPGTSNLSFARLDGQALLASLPDLAVSSGSACSTTHSEPSPVLTAMGVPRGLATSAIRFSFGRFTTDDEVETAAGRIIEEVERLRSLRT